MKTFLAILAGLSAVTFLLWIISLAYALYERRYLERRARREQQRFQRLPIGEKLEEYAKKQGWLK